MAEVAFVDQAGTTFSTPSVACYAAAYVACTNTSGVATMAVVATKSGTHQLKANVDGTTTGAQKNFSVTAGPIATVALSGSTADLTAGVSRSFTATAVDQYANTIALSATNPITYAADPADSIANDSVA